MSAATLIAGLVIVIGLIGIVVPVLPGLALVWAAVLGWALSRHDTGAWLALAVVTALFVGGAILKYLLPGRRLAAAGVPGRTLAAGAAVALIGLFVIPLVGLPVGFVAGVFLAERWRLDSAEAARDSTVLALKAAGWSLLIEFATGLLMALTWLVMVISGA